MTLKNKSVKELVQARIPKGQHLVKKCKELLGNQMYSHYCTDGFQFCIPTRENYKKLQSTGFFSVTMKK